ncbi:MAG: DUF975 family protein [Bacteroidales bacterium]|nr:DUF975 family protein [Bacteroidales bacterium]
MESNRNLRAESRKSLSGKWGLGAVVALIVTAISVTGSFFPALSLLITLLVSTVLGYGVAVTFLRSFRGEPLEVENLFIGFRTYGKVLGVMLLVFLYTMLWSLLFLVPGIIKAYSYAMTPYILHDDPTVGADEAIERSKSLMNGYKAKLFLLDLSFIGWGLLCVLTLGIGFLWLMPYMQTARAAFYEDVRNAAAPVA